MIQRHRSRQTGLAYIASLIIVSFAVPASAEMEKLYSADTIAFAHWDGWLDPDGPTAKLARQVAARLAQETEFEGAEAGEFVELLIDLAPAKTGVGFYGVRDVDGEPVPDVAITMRGVKNPEGALARFRAMVDDESAFSATTVGGNPLTLWKPDSDVDLHLGVVDGVLVFTTSKLSAEKIVVGVRGGSGSLADAEEFRTAAKQARRDADAETCGLFIDVRALVGMIEEIIKKEEGALPEKWNTILEEVGIRDIKSLYWSHGSKGDVDQGTFFVHTAPDANRGIISLYRQEPFDTAELAIVPQDAYWLKAGSLDLYAIWKEALRIVEAIEPEAAPQVEGGVAMTKQMFGFSLTEDFLPMLGKSWVMYDAPAHGGLFLTGTVIATRPKSAADLNAMVERFVDVATPFATQGKIDLRRHNLNYDGQNIHYVLGGNQPSPFVLSWVTKNDRTLFASSPHVAAAALKQFGETSAEKSVLSAPNMNILRTHFPQELTGLAYFNSKQQKWLFYSLFQLLHNAACSYAASQGAEVDFAVLPPYPEYAAGRHNFLATSWHESNGLYFSYAGNLNLITPGGTFIAATSAAILVPSLTRARHLARRSVSLANLRSIAMACHAYAADHEGEFPANLKVLVDEGLANELVLQSPRAAGGETISYILVPISNASMQPSNILAYEIVRDAEGTSVVFADGAARFLSIPEFERSLRETYERLGKLDELPEEFRE